MPNRIHKHLSRIVDIKPDEVSTSVLIFTFFFLITAPHTIFKALRYADLLIDIGPQGLPLAYLLAAVATGLVVVLHSKIQARLPLQVLILASLFFFVITGLLFIFIIDSESHFVSYLYWVWAGILVVLLMTHFGLTVNEVFNPREAKRLIGFCGSGGILGGLVGGLVGFLLIKIRLETLLLPLACGLLLTSVFVVRAIFVVQSRRQASSWPGPKKKYQTQEWGFGDSFRAVAKSRYLVLIALMVIVSVIVTTFIDFQFSSQVRENYVTQEKLQAFFTLFFGLLTIVAFFLQILLASIILKKPKGILLTLLFTPLILMMGSFGIVFGGLTLFSAIFVKGSDDSLAYSLNQSVREILYIPVDISVRYKARPLIDMFINRVAKVIAAAVLFILGIFLGVQNQPYRSPIIDLTLAEFLSWGVIVFSALWILLNLWIYREYVGAIKQKIKRQWSRVDRDVAQKIDIPFTKQVFDTMESKGRSPVLYAMHLYELMEQGRLTPEIKKMISEKVDDLRISSMADLFSAEGAYWFPEAEDNLALDRFIAEVREIISLESYQKLIDEKAGKMMEGGEESETGRMELAKAIGMMDPAAPLVKRLFSLIDDDSLQVVRLAIESAAKLQKKELIPALIEKLGNTQTREDATAALLKYGPMALGKLKKLLGSKGADIGITRAAVSVLARMGVQKAADIMLDELARCPDELTPHLVEALDQIRSERPEIHIPEAVPRKKTFEMVKRYCELYIEWNDLKQKEDKNVGESIQRAMDSRFADIFKLLGLYHPHDEIVRAYQNLKSGKKESMDYAVEMLDNTLKKDIRDIILPLIVDVSPYIRIQRFRLILGKHL